MTESQQVREAYQQGHKDACTDPRCVLLGDSRMPTYAEGHADGQEMVRKEVGLLIDRVRELVWKASQYGTTEDGDTYAYLVPKGVMHRLVGEAQAHGFTSVAFRDPSRENSECALPPLAQNGEPR